MSLNFSVEDTNNSINFEVSGDKYYAGLAEEWAISPTKVQNKDFSSKYYANLAVQASETASNSAQIVSDAASSIESINDNITDINTVAGAISDVSSVAGSISDIGSVSNDLTNIDTVAADLTNIDTVANGISNIGLVAGNISNVSSVASNLTDINAVADDLTNIDAVYNNITNINAVNSNKTNIDTVAGSISNIGSVADNLTNINTVSSNLNNINAVNNNSTNINTVAGSISDISSVVSNLSSINAVANDLTNIDNASTYADNSAIWAEGTDNEVSILGGIHSAKEWANVASQGQIQANWNETDTTSKAYIQNKPTIPNAQIQSDWNQTDNTAKDYIKNKPVQNTYFAGEGIIISPKLQTSVGVECSNENLTVISSYEDVENSTGVKNYNFKYETQTQLNLSWQPGDYSSGNLLIIDGKLYVNNLNSTTNQRYLELIDSDNTWSLVSGYFGVKNGNLYAIYDIETGIRYIEPVLIDNTGIWTKLSPGKRYYSNLYFNPDNYYFEFHSLGIKNGNLYEIKIANTNTSHFIITLLNDSGTWTAVSQSYCVLCNAGDKTNSSINYGTKYMATYAINNGYLYKIETKFVKRTGFVTYITQADNNSNWNMVSGVSGLFKDTLDTILYAYAIRNGNLYKLESTNYSNISTTTTDTTITALDSTGTCSYCECIANESDTRGLVLKNNYLYEIKSDATFTLRDNSRTWSSLSLNSIATAYATSNGSFYYIIYGYSNDISQIGTNNDWSANRLGYAVRDNCLYFANGSSAIALLKRLQFTSTGWYLLDNELVDLNDYDLTVTGTPQVNDTIDLTYTTTEIPNQYVISASTNTSQGV